MTHSIFRGRKLHLKNSVYTIHSSFLLSRRVIGKGSLYSFLTSNFLSDKLTSGIVYWLLCCSLSIQFLVCGMCGVLCARKRTGLIVSTCISFVCLFPPKSQSSVLYLFLWKLDCDLYKEHIPTAANRKSIQVMWHTSVWWHKHDTKL